MARIQDYEVYYDGQDPSAPAHIFEQINNQSADATALCGAARPANQRSTQQGTRPPNTVCLKCETLLTQREGLPLNPPRRPGAAAPGRGWCPRRTAGATISTAEV